MIHKVAIVRTESAGGDYWLALCPCGWRRNIAVDAPFYGYTAEDHMRRWSKRHETYPPTTGRA
mgnify:CR=1 FL=1